MSSISYIAEIADAITAYITTTGLAEARRTYMPEVELEKIGSTPVVYVRSSVLETPRRDVPHSRTSRFMDIPYDMMLLARVSTCTNEDLDRVIAIYENLDELIYKNLRTIATSFSRAGMASWLESSVNTLFSQDNFREQKVAQVNGQIVYRYQI